MPLIISTRRFLSFDWCLCLLSIPVQVQVLLLPKPLSGISHYQSTPLSKKITYLQPFSGTVMLIRPTLLTGSRASMAISMPTPVLQRTVPSRFHWILRRLLPLSSSTISTSIPTVQSLELESSESSYFRWQTPSQRIRTTATAVV
jgi:hypothetical protein